MDYAIGGIAVAALILGVVEAFKSFGVDGRWSQLLALGLGVLFVGLAYGMDQMLIPEAVHPYIVGAVTALAGGLAAMGYFDLAKRFANVDRKHE